MSTANFDAPFISCVHCWEHGGGGEKLAYVISVAFTGAVTVMALAMSLTAMFSFTRRAEKAGFVGSTRANEAVMLASCATRASPVGKIRIMIRRAHHEA